MLRLRHTLIAVCAAALVALSPALVATPASAASTVSGISVTDAQPTAMTINWDAYPGATRYRVYVTPTSAMPGTCEPHCTVITPKNLAEPSHRLTGLDRGATYWIKVSALNSAGKTITGWQAAAHQVVLPSKATVTGISVSDPQPTSMTINWDAFDGAAQYRVYVSPTKDMPFHCEPHCTVITPSEHDQPGYTATGLATAADYWIKISAIDSAGKTISSWQPDALKTSLPAKGTVTGISVSDTQTTSMTIDWDAYPGATRYRVYVTPTSAMPGTCEPHCTVITPKNLAEPSHQVTGLKPGGRYWIKISALNSAGKTITGWQQIPVTTTLPETGVVSGISTTPATTSLTIDWNRYPGAVRYRVYVAPTSDMPYYCEPHCTVITPKNAAEPSYTISDLDPGSSHWIKISAINAAGRTISDWQDSPVKATLLKKGVVGGLAVEPGVTDATISWNAYPEAAKYRVYITPTSSMPGACEPHCTVITPDNPQKPSYTVKGLDPGEDYWVKVSALNSSGRTITGWQSSPVKTILLTLDADLTVASFNVKCTSCLTMPIENRPPLERPWVDRRTDVAKRIVSRHPDIVGIQEASQAWIYEDGKQINRSQFEDLLKEMKANGGSSYALVNTHRNNCVKSTTPTNCVYKDQGASKGTKIIYNTATTTVLSSGSYRLESAGTNRNERYLAWAIVQDKDSGQKYFFADTHLEPGREFYDVRKTQAQQLVAEVKRRNSDNLPVVLVGDFNSTRYFEPSNAPYDTFIAAGLIDPLGHTYKSPKISPLATAEKRIHANYNSFGNFSPIQRKYLENENGSNLDYILTSPMRVLQWETVVNVGSDGNIVGQIPSDHNMIVARLLMTAN